jgi:uncharacterized protein YprB with RNaseH-like and TPR domain
MAIPQRYMRMDNLRWMNTHLCSHGHTYLEHFPCFLKEVDHVKKIGFFDIESSSLVADFGFCIGWYILDNDNHYYGRVVTPEEVHSDIPDKKIMEELVETMKSFDILYTYNGTRFDLPFVRTRCVSNNIRFPFYGAVKHKDVYFIIKNKFRLHRKSQEVAAEFLLGSTNKTHWMGKYWIKAVQGDPKALAYIDHHCRMDCKDLKRLTEKTLEFVQPIYRSI